jgi:hypothetical protein
MTARPLAILVVSAFLVSLCVWWNIEQGDFLIAVLAGMTAIFSFYLGMRHG